MDARSEGDETPLWLDAHACQEARSGGINASRRYAFMNTPG